MQAKTFIYASAILVLTASYGCAGKNASPTQSSGGEDSTKLPPVETNQPNSKYKPAFEGQTRIAGIKTVTPYKVDKLADSLGNPWAVIPMPDGRLLISIKAGFMQIHDSTGALVKRLPVFLKWMMTGRVACWMLHWTHRLPVTKPFIGPSPKSTALVILLLLPKGS